MQLVTTASCHNRVDAFESAYMKPDWGKGGVLGHMEGTHSYAQCPKLEDDTHLMK